MFQHINVFIAIIALFRGGARVELVGHGGGGNVVLVSYYTEHWNTIHVVLCFELYFEFYVSYFA